MSVWHTATFLETSNYWIFPTHSLDLDLIAFDTPTRNPTRPSTVTVAI